MHDVRRLAPASIGVVQRNAGKPALAAYIPTMVPMANGVLAAIQDLDMLKTDQVALIGRSDAQTAVLNDVLLVWSGRLVRDVEGFDIGAYTRNASLTFDVVQKANSLKQLVEQKGAELPYRETLVAELTARIDSARVAEDAAHGARVALQEKQRQVRELVASFHKELVSLRRTVRAVLGSSHFDYQRLRVPDRAVAEPSDEASEAEPSETESGASSPSETS
jgi:hypothetical protein